MNSYFLITKAVFTLGRKRWKVEGGTIGGIDLSTQCLLQDIIRADEINFCKAIVDHVMMK